MKVRPVDGSGDMLPIYESSQMLEGAEAIAQIVKERLLFMRGEWWEDETLGIGIPDFLSRTVKSEQINLLDKYITSYIGETEGVEAVTNATVEFVDRVLILKCVVQTSEGSALVEVNLNGLL